MGPLLPNKSCKRKSGRVTGTGYCVLRVFFWTLFKGFKLGVPFFIESHEQVQIQAGSHIQARNGSSLSCIHILTSI